MNIEMAFELAYQQLPDSEYGKYTGFRRIVGLLSLMVDSKNRFINPLIHIEKDLENNGVIYFIQNTDKSFIVNCLDAPDYENKFALSHWVKMEILKVEKNLGSEFFKSRPINPVQGKTF
ncbi:hypothetical protein MMP66_07900 [Acinetobacter dispersus]|uniref:hypothetical protein n=1 Tax=Acinetobacter dispersus TaxID=70348 RepID=UPI001F4A1084|nr:hypothetical protein [Acinetobacter dispersus]MCH7394203.1 hypothetical protein [Acinetobacter dispersus]